MRVTGGADRPGPEAPARGRPSAMHRLHVRVSYMQRAVARALGISWAHRTDTVLAMLTNNARRAPGYWIQLALSMGIATFGLVLGSTAVVIGGMLVSPLMAPIVELGMGFAVGSTLLVLRSALRGLLSIVVVVAGAALITLALPFHELTPEIASRTAPTALDLLVAVFCALTAAYTTVRDAAETTAAAAGTAIGIALVPPLCVVGYGIGTRAPDVALGAALLFTANGSAIILFTVLAFVLVGYNWVDDARLERECLRLHEHDAERVAARAHRALQRVLGSRYGVAMRIGFPLLLLALVYVPLERALDEVAWEVGVRGMIGRVVEEEARGEAVQMGVHVDRRQVALQLLLPGTDGEADSLERRIAARLADAGASQAEVRVTAVADARAIAAALARTERGAARDGLGVPATAAAFRAAIERRLAARWPAAAAGPLVGWSAVTRSDGSLQVTVHHLGAPIGAVAETLLGAELSGALGALVRVTSVALPPEPLLVAAGGEAAWLARAEPLLAAIAAAPGAVACVLEPPAGRSANGARPAGPLRRTLDSSAVARAGRLRVAPGAAWTLWAADGACTPEPPAAVARPDGDA